MLANIILSVVLVIFAAAMTVWWRSSSATVTTTNSLLKHRQKRVRSHIGHTDLPDASAQHEHEKKLKVKKEAVISPYFFEFTLITSIDEKHQYHKMNSKQTMRKPHPLLSKLTCNITNAKTLYETVKTDPELVAKIINVANSPLFGLSKPITNVHHAIVYLGIVQVKNIATHFALQQTLAFKNKKQQLAYQQIWSTSFLASSIMLVLATAMEFDNSAELSTRCQLGYLGDISTLFSHPETSQLYVKGQSYLDRIDHIQKLTHANTAILGGILAKKWNLPAEIATGLHNSGLPFTNQLEGTGLSDNDIQEILMCYCCCRIAEVIIIGGNNDILKADALSFEETGKEEFYHMPALLEKYRLTKLSTIFASQSIKIKMLEMVRLTNEKHD